MILTMSATQRQRKGHYVVFVRPDKDRLFPPLSRSALQKTPGSRQRRAVQCLCSLVVTNLKLMTWTVRRLALVRKASCSLARAHLWCGGLRRQNCFFPGLSAREDARSGKPALWTVFCLQSEEPRVHWLSKLPRGGNADWEWGVDSDWFLQL